MPDQTRVSMWRSPKGFKVTCGRFCFGIRAAQFLSQIKIAMPIVGCYDLGCKLSLDKEISKHFGNCVV